MAMPTRMTDVNAQLTLQTWMSAAFPIGAFTCSHGLEAAIADHRIGDADSCEQWITSLVECGSLWNDAVITHCAYATVSDYLQNENPACAAHLDPAKALLHSLTELNDLALALCSGAERHRETTQLGQAFGKATASWIVDKPAGISALEHSLCLPVIIGLHGALAAIPEQQLLPACLQSASSNLVWICTRLVPLGQSQALSVIASLSARVQNTADRALHSTLKDLGSSTLLADLASIEHEQLHSRICIT